MRDVRGYVIMRYSHGKMQVFGKSSVPSLSYQSMEGNGLTPFGNRDEMLYALEDMQTEIGAPNPWRVRNERVVTAFLNMRIAYAEPDLTALSKWKRGQYAVVLTNGEGDQLLGAIDGRFTGEPMFGSCGPLSECAVYFDSFQDAEDLRTRIFLEGYDRVAIAMVGLRGSA